MSHGNKRYFFERLKLKGDTIIVKPQDGQQIVNVYSAKNQLKSFQKENEEFEFDTELNKNGSLTITRLS